MALRRAWLLLVLALLTGACAGQGFVFRQDDRVSIVEPADREEVSGPVTVRWEIDEKLAADLQDPSEGAAGFAVVLDQHPQPPGETIAWFARGDDGCTPETQCPTLDYLADRRVFTTRANSITFDAIGDAPSGNERHHEVTIFLIDAKGKRLSETAWTVEFRRAKEAP